MEGAWNPWHGCKKYSEGCLNCYVYRRDESVGRDAGTVTKTAEYRLPTAKKRDGEYKLTSRSGTVYTCMTSDFFIEEADEWRGEAWRMIKERSDLDFFIFTKRIVRVKDCLPSDWGEGYENVTLCCTVESQKQCDIRLPILLDLPAKRKEICCEPLLTAIDFHGLLDKKEISCVSVGGESGENARVCDFEWVLGIREQSVMAGIPFHYHQTGYRLRKDGKIYLIPRKFQHTQAGKSGIDYFPRHKE